MEDFKARWIPDNAHVHLVDKLERAELKRGSVGTFNDEFRSILALLGTDDVATCKESNRYYKIYFSKLRDAQVLLSVQQHSMQTRGGLNLEQLMEYTSKLMLAKPKLPVFNHPNTAKPAKKPYQTAIHNTEDTADTVTVNAMASRYDEPRECGPRTCYACSSTSHVVPGCDPVKKKSFWDGVNKRRAEQATNAAEKV